MALIIKQCGISEVLARIDLMEEYASESSIDGLPSPMAKSDMYLNMESNDALYTIGAFFDEVLVGFVTILTPILPHYSILIAVTESFFVAKNHRKRGGGLRLLRAAERHAKERGSPGLIVSAPYGGSLAEVMSRLDYTETNRVFFKKFDNE